MDSTEPSLPHLIVVQGKEKLLFREIRPQGVGEIELCVGSLPEEKVARAFLTAVNDELCSGCAICVSMCPYTARSMDPDRGVVVVNEVLCEGCGACAAACPSGAAQQRNTTDDQIFSMLRAMLRE